MRLKRTLPAIPPFRSAAETWARAARSLRPKTSILVSEWAVKNNGYDPAVLPWQVEIMDALGAGGDVDLQGAAQIGKSAIGCAWWGWSIDHSPADFLICNPSKDMMQDFVVRRLDPMVRGVKVLRDALSHADGADNIFTKRFAGMISSHVWPVAAQFRARPVPRGWLDDFDQIPDDIEGQGSAHKLMQARQTWFEGRAGTFSSSSPAREEGGGIAARVRGGTWERLHPECPECGERFRIELEKHLRFTRGASAEVAEKSAHLVCPVHGCIIEPRQKRRMIAGLAALPNKGFVAEQPFAGRRTFQVDGLMSVTSWGRLAKDWREAEIAWEERQDETDLRAFFNTKAGVNYRSRLAGAKRIETADLEKRIEKGWRLGTVPAGVEVLVSAIDVQGNRFEVITVGFGAGLESWLVDRFDIHLLADGQTLVEPALYAEHWDVLTEAVVQRRYPMAADPSRTMPVLTTACDTGGEGGVSANAAAWWRRAISAGVHKDRITLVKGSNNPKQLRLIMAGWLDVKNKGGGDRRGVRSWNVNTHALKSIWNARLLRPAPGPGFVHIPEGFESAWLDELTAEELRGGKWIKLRPRNETLDLAVYAAAAIARPPFAQTRTDTNWIPAAFRAPRIEAPTITIVASPMASAVPASKPPPAKPPARPGPGRRPGGGWMKRARG